jgi:hypothetical protein
MMLIGGVGVYGYAVASEFNNIIMIGMIFTLDSMAQGSVFRGLVPPHLVFLV